MEAGITDPFVGFGDAAKTKVVLLGSSARLPLPLRSLNLEHVSPARLSGLEISPHPTDQVGVESSQLLGLLKRWYYARKPDAGFVLTDFPATLLQAKVFDEWMESRQEGLSAVLAGPGAPVSIVDHYRILGLLRETSDFSS